MKYYSIILDFWIKEPFTKYSQKFISLTYLVIILSELDRGPPFYYEVLICEDISIKEADQNSLDRLTSYKYPVCLTF